jgi:hypothetical protein
MNIQTRADSLDREEGADSGKPNVSYTFLSLGLCILLLERSFS